MIPKTSICLTFLLIFSHHQSCQKWRITPTDSLLYFTHALRIRQLKTKLYDTLYLTRKQKIRTAYCNSGDLIRATTENPNKTGQKNQFALRTQIFAYITRKSSQWKQNPRNEQRKEKEIKRNYHPWRRLWRLIVYSLVTTSSFLPFVFSTILNSHPLRFPLQNQPYQ